MSEDNMVVVAIHHVSIWTFVGVVSFIALTIAGVI